MTTPNDGNNGNSPVPSRSFPKAFRCSLYLTPSSDVLGGELVGTSGKHDNLAAHAAASACHTIIRYLGVASKFL